MLKVLHGADFHLDSPFSGLKPDAAARRRGEQRELLARLTDLAREREADLVLLSGDLLDGDLVFRETVQALARALGPEHLVWRYDPICYGPGLGRAEHIAAFARLAGQLAGQLETRVFDTKIRSGVAIAEAPAHGESIFEYSPRASAVKDYGKFLDEVEKIIGFREK